MQLCFPKVSSSFLWKIKKVWRKKIGILAKLRHFVSYQTLLSLNYAFFDTHVSYSLNIFGHLKCELMDKISKLQNKALRIIHFKKNTDSILPIHLQCKVLPVDRFLKLKNCLMAQDFLKGNLPNYFCRIWLEAKFLLQFLDALVNYRVLVLIFHHFN